MTLESSRTQRDIALADAEFLVRQGRYRQAIAALWVASEFQIMIEEFGNNKKLEER